MLMLDRIVVASEARRRGNLGDVLPSAVEERSDMADEDKESRSPLSTRTSLLMKVRDAGDKAAWDEFHSLYRKILFNYLVEFKKVPASDAEDVIQEVFIILMRVLPTFTLDRSRGKFRAFLFRLTTNALNDHYRRRSSRDRVEKAKREQTPDVVADGQEPDEAWNNLIRQGVLGRVLPLIQEETNELTWKCFEEHVLKSRKSKDVAAELGMKPNTVTKNAARVLDKVRERCLDYEEDLGDDAPNLSR